MKVKDIQWIESSPVEGDHMFAFSRQEKGDRITVLDRVTGFKGQPRDVETGYRNKEGKFWLASGMFDIREFPDMEIDEAVAHIKERANTCVGT